MTSRHVLVTGGGGYIGSHVCKCLAKAGYLPITYDHFQQGHLWAVNWGPYVQGDILDRKKLGEAFQTYKPVAVIHLASYINVRESQSDPGKYYQNNVGGTLSLLETMKEHGIKHIVFSSTAAVYGIPSYFPLDEAHPKSPINVYGKTKLMVEEILKDYSHLGLCSAILRYFNASGADPECEIGEAHSPETHLIPLLIASALDKTLFTIFGQDHPTPDGTCIRDFIHVCDLADAHVRALEWILNHNESLELNLGTGKGLSIKEIIQEVEAVSSQKIAVEMGKRNVNEPSTLIADSAKAQSVLNWEPAFSDIKTIVQTAWNWHTKKN